MNGSLQALLTQKPIAVGPGAYDALTAMLAASAGFPAFHVSGPIVGAQELEDLDCSRVIFPGAIVRAIAHTAREFYSTLADDGASGALRHRMFDSDAGGFVEAAVHAREALAPGASVTGPAIIVERETATIVTSAFGATVQRDGCLLVARIRPERPN